ncbi:MAG TPA: NUDIX hydrolase [Candidatus Binatia bacterium]|nr:NUDIX hydrolase [Candidatus Binatia bacterium]
MSDRTPAVAHPAATVVLLRDAADACEVLLVRRSAQLAFHGGAWVFPGGRIDPEDYAAAGSDAVIVAARHAAVREAREEAGLSLAASDLVLISRWITPEPLPKRFDTWFFAAPAAGHDVQVDGGEIHDHRWFRVADALAAQKAGEIELPPPTFVTILSLAEHGSVRDALAAFARDPVLTFAPRLATVTGSPCTLYEGDVGYEGGDATAPGPRHRLVMQDGDWRYERSD